MEDMYVHQHAKVEPNRSRGGAAIGADARTRSPPTQTLYENFLQSTDIISPICILYTLYMRQTSLQTYP